MAVLPTKPAAGMPTNLSAAGSTQKGTHRVANSPYGRAAHAEHEANTRIQQAAKKVEQAQREAANRIDDIRDESDIRTEAERQRNTENLETIRAEGYEKLRDLKNRYARELMKATQEHEKELAKTQHHFGTKIQETHHQSEKQLNEMKTKLSQLEGYELREGANRLKQIQAQNQQQVEALRSNDLEKIEALRAGSAQEHERMKENYSKATEKSQSVFEGNFQAKLNAHNQVLDRLHRNTSRQIQEIRDDTSLRLNAYSDRQRDPFYRLVELNADLFDAPDEYILTAQIPAHERSRLSVAVRGDKLVLSGSRQNVEELEVAPGKTRSTSSYQSYSETFPISDAVIPRYLTKEFEGDTLIVRLPKKGGAPERPPYQKPVEKVRAERPRFPENIPVAPRLASQESKSDPEAPPAPSPRRPGTGTLS